MSNSKINNIFAPSDCLSEDMLLRYTQNQLSNLQRNQVEQHTINCKLCNDALAGFEDHQESISRFNQIKTKFASPEKKKTPFVWIGIAASILVILMVTNVFEFTNKNEIAENIKDLSEAKEEEEKQQNPQKEILGDQKNYNESTPNEVAKSTYKKVKAGEKEKALFSNLEKQREPEIELEDNDSTLCCPEMTIEAGTAGATYTWTATGADKPQSLNGNSFTLQNTKKADKDIKIVEKDEEEGIDYLSDDLANVESEKTVVRNVNGKEREEKKMKEAVSKIASEPIEEDEEILVMIADNNGVNADSSITNQTTMEDAEKDNSIKETKAEIIAVDMVVSEVAGLATGDQNSADGYEAQTDSVLVLNESKKLAQSKTAFASKENKNVPTFSLGKSAYGEKKWNTAILHLSTIKSENTNYAEANYMLGKSYLAIGNKEKAKVAFNNVIASENLWKSKAQEELKKLN